MTPALNQGFTGVHLSMVSEASTIDVGAIAEQLARPSHVWVIRMPNGLWCVLPEDGTYVLGAMDCEDLLPPKPLQGFKTERFEFEAALELAKALGVDRLCVIRRGQGYFDSYWVK